MKGLSDAIPSEDIKEIGDAVRSLEKLHKRVLDQIAHFTSKEEMEERQAKAEKEAEERANALNPENMTDEKILASLTAFADEVEQQLIEFDVQTLDADLFESLS